MNAFLVEGIRAHLARDRVFSFYYEDNLDLLQQNAAEILAASLIADSTLPENLAALHFGGGYLFLQHASSESFAEQP